MAKKVLVRAFVEYVKEIEVDDSADTEDCDQMDDLIQDRGFRDLVVEGSDPVGWSFDDSYYEIDSASLT